MNILLKNVITYIKIGPRALQLTAVPCKLKSILSEISAILSNDLVNEVELKVMRRFATYVFLLALAIICEILGILSHDLGNEVKG